MILKSFLNRNILLLFIARTLSSFGDGIFFIAISWFVYNINKSTADLGMFHAVTAIPTLLIIPIIGVWVDKYPRQYIAAIADLLRVFILFLLILAIAFNLFQLWNVYVLNIVLGLGEVTYFIAFFGLTPIVVKKESILECNSLIMVGLQSGYLLGSASAGFIIDLISINGALLINLISFLVSAICILLLKIQYQSTESEKAPAKKNEYFQNIRKGILYIWKDKSILLLVLLSTVPHFFINSINIAIPAFIATDLKAGPSALGLVDSALGVGAIFGALAIQYLNKKGYGNIYFWLGFFLLSITTFVFSLARHVPVAFIINFLVGLTYAGIGIIYQSKIQTNIAENYLGRVNSFRRLFMNILNPFVLIIVGYIGKMFSNRFIFISISIVLILLAILGFFVKKKMDMEKVPETANTPL